MTNASRDDNQVPVLIGTSNADGSTPLPVYVDPTTHIMATDDNTSGSDLSDDIADRDDNMVPVAMGVSEADGTTPVAIYVDSATNKLLVDST